MMELADAVRMAYEKTLGIAVSDHSIEGYNPFEMTQNLRVYYHDRECGRKPDIECIDRSARDSLAISYIETRNDLAVSQQPFRICQLYTLFSKLMFCHGCLAMANYSGYYHPILIQAVVTPVSIGVAYTIDLYRTLKPPKDALMNELESAFNVLAGNQHKEEVWTSTLDASREHLDSLAQQSISQTLLPRNCIEAAK